MGMCAATGRTLRTEEKSPLFGKATDSADVLSAQPEAGHIMRYGPHIQNAERATT